MTQAKLHYLESLLDWQVQTGAPSPKFVRINSITARQRVRLRKFDLGTSYNIQGGVGAKDPRQNIWVSGKDWTLANGQAALEVITLICSVVLNTSSIYCNSGSKD